MTGLVFHARTDFLRRVIEENPDYFQRLPKAEQDLYDLYIVKNLNQKEIADLLELTQGAISSRLKKIGDRLLFMEKLKAFNMDQLEESLAPLFNSIEMELLKGMLETTCQSETARRLNETFNLTDDLPRRAGNFMTQVKVRHRFEKCLAKMKEKNSPYYELFSLIKENLYILHEVKLPHFARGVRHEKIR